MEHILHMEWRGRTLVAFVDGAAVARAEPTVIGPDWYFSPALGEGRLMTEADAKVALIDAQIDACGAAAL